MKLYYIIDNSGNLFKKSFSNDSEAFSYFRNHWEDYISSCLSCDYISVANEDKYYIFQIDTVKGCFYFTKHFKEM